jgi:hypothetical protein
VIDLDELKHEVARLEAELSERDRQAQEKERQLERYAADLRETFKEERARAQELRDSYVATVRALGNAVEARDAYTGKHAERVAAYGLEIARVVERALTHAPAARPRLRCAPELVERLRALLAERGLEARIEPAPELLPREAQIFWDQGYDHLDLDACIAEIRACIASHVHRDSTSERHEQEPR